jgi:hypothetical protein
VLGLKIYHALGPKRPSGLAAPALRSGNGRASTSQQAE